MENETATQGRLLCVTSGVYSDFGVTGFFVVIQSFKPMDEVASYLKDNPVDENNYMFNGNKFLAFLLAKGYLLEITYAGLHLGDYDRVDEVRFQP